MSGTHNYNQLTLFEGDGKKPYWYRYLSKQDKKRYRFDK